jgi:hypothetical protein
MIPLFKFGRFPQTVFHPAIGMLDFVGFLLFRCPRGGFEFFGSGSQCMEFVVVPLPHIGGTLSKFGFKSGPYILFILLVFGLEQPEGFLRAQLGNSGEILDPNRSRISARVSSPAPRHKGHSIFSAGMGESVVREPP